jgi:hypothetical protein
MFSLPLLRGTDFSQTIPFLQLQVSSKAKAIRDIYDT